MRNGWVKLHTKVLDNHIFRHDPTAWQIFTYLLLRGYDDKSYPPGKTSTTRQQIADLLHVNNNTVYSALKRLEKAKMITTSSTKVSRKFTIISICNWGVYQSQDNGTVNNVVNNPATIKQQSNNSLNRNIDIRLKNNLSTNVDKLAKAKKSEIDEMFDYWKQVTGIPISARLKQNRFACSNLIKKHGVDGVRKLIGGVAQAQNDQYAPRIADFTQLQSKLNELLVWGKKNVTMSKGVKL